MYREFSGVYTLNITTSSQVVIDRANQVAVRVTGTNAEKVRVTLSDGELHIDDGEAAESGVTIINTSGGSFTSFSDGGVVMSGGNMSVNVNGANIRVVNGVTYVNGQRVDVGTPTEKIKPLRIEVLCPPGLALRLNVRGCGSVESSPLFKRARVKLSGTAAASVETENLSADCSGCAKVVATGHRGILAASVSGSSSVSVRGSFQSIDAQASGSATVDTHGSVADDFDGSASGCGRVSHRGKIGGSKSRDTSGCGRVDWD